MRTNQRWLLTLLLALGLAACGPAPEVVGTAIAQTEAMEQTLTAGAPTATFTASPTNTITATPTPVDSPTATPVPTDTPSPTPSDTPVPTDTATPAATSTKTVPPPPPATPTNTPPPPPDFVAIAKDVRSQVDGIGGQIDLALRIGGFDCQQLINTYEYVVARHDLTLPPDVAGPYATYQAGIDVFIAKVHDLYNDCVFILGAEYYHFIPQETWSLARIGVNDSRDLITQAIVEAGGVP